MPLSNIVSTTLAWSRASDATTSERNQKLGLRFEEFYHIHTHVDATELDIYADAGLPQIGSSYEFFQYAYADSIRLNKVSPVVWNATVSYSGEMNGFHPDGTPKSPLLAPPIIEWDDVESTVEIDSDYNGLPFTNTVGDRVSGITREEPDQTLYIKRNFASFSSYAQSAYRRSVNSDEFAGWPPGTGKLKKYKARLVRNETIGYWEVEAMIQFRVPAPGSIAAKAWWARYISKGKRERLTAPPILVNYIVPAKGEDGSLIEVFLDATGARTDPDTPYFIERQIYGALPYNDLGLLS